MNYPEAMVAIEARIGQLEANLAQQADLLRRLLNAVVGAGKWLAEPRFVQYTRELDDLQAKLNQVVGNRPRLVVNNVIPLERRPKRRRRKGARCAAVRNDGQPCGASPKKGHTLCATHLRH